MGNLASDRRSLVGSVWGSWEIYMPGVAELRVSPSHRGEKIVDNNLATK